jgi:serine/threonine protein kinase
MNFRGVKAMVPIHGPTDLLYYSVSFARVTSLFNVYRRVVTWLQKSNISADMKIRKLSSPVRAYEEASAVFDDGTIELSDDDAEDAHGDAALLAVPGADQRKRTWLELQEEDEADNACEELRHVRQRLAEAERKLAESRMVQADAIEMDTFLRRFNPGRCIARLGDGCCASVFMGRVSDTKVALKRLEFSKENLDNLQHELTIQHELRSQHVLPHLGLYTVWEAACPAQTEPLSGQDPTWLVAASLFCEGGSLWSFLSRVGRAAVPTVAYVLHAAAAGLQHMHDKKVIHNDVKPGNLLVTGTGRLIIHDFGLSVTSATSAFLLGSYGGTSSYAPPEWKQGVSFKTDTFALGVTILELYLGYCTERTFDGIIKLPGSLPGAAFAVLARMLSLDHASRPTMEEVLQSDFAKSAPQQPPQELCR